MADSWIRRITRSIFTKLLVVVLFTGLVIHILVGGFFWAYRTMISQPFQKNIAQYLDYMIADMGLPPNPERAQRLAEQSSLQIHFEGREAKWSTSGKFPKIRQRRLHSLPEYPNIRFGKHRRRPLVQVDRPQGRYIFELAPFHHPDPEHRKPMVILLVVLTLILVGTFFLIRRILRPVRWLNEGVQEVGQGNLNHRVPEKGADELKRLAEAFNDMTQRIRDMLQTKEQLLLDVSHELRSPLTRMKVALEFLPDSQAKTSLAGDMAEMEKMISEILENARMHHLHGRLNRKPYNLVELLEQILPEFVDLPPGVHSENLPSEAICSIDPEQAGTALKNVLTNAIKYSTPESAPVVITMESKPPYVIIRIADNGIGIPEEEQPYIFEPFYRVDKSRTKGTGGFGLGLSLCKTIMEAHGGKIELESRPGEGTIVSLFFSCEKII